VYTESLIAEIASPVCHIATSYSYSYGCTCQVAMISKSSMSFGNSTFSSIHKSAYYPWHT